MLKVSRTVTGLAAALGLAACTVQKTPMPGLTGPSELALSLSVTATPDSISQDGASQSSILVVARDPNGRGIAALPIRLDMAVGGVFQDFGRLSARTIVTGTDGRASTVYTAPAAPPVNLGGAGTFVTIVATPTGTDFRTALAQTADIRLVPPGVILPPAGTPFAAFAFSPASPIAKAATLFDASASDPGFGASEITSFVWDFGDGTAQGSGRNVSHVFAVSGTFNVTLTVTNDRGIAASTTQPVSVDPAEGPRARFSFSPSAPGVQQTVIFDASTSTAGEGHTIASYRWSFGDGATGTGVTASHAYALAGAYSVQLTVTDEVGQTNTSVTDITVSATAPTIPDFQISPSAPQVDQVVTFNGSQARAGVGHTLVSHSWNFGDGATATGVVVTHTYATQGSFNVTLTATDEIGQFTTLSKAVTVAFPLIPTASFTASPTSPGVNELAFFDASASVAAPGHTIASYFWTFGDGATGGGVLVQHAFASAGEYTVQLTVTDDVGQTASASKSITVGSPPGPTANFTFSPTAPLVAQQVVFDASSSTTAQGQTIIHVDWNFGDGTPIIRCPGDAACNGTRIIAHTFSAAGTYTVNLVVTDSALRTASQSATVTVGSGNPTAILTVSKTGGNSVVGDGGASFATGSSTIATYTFFWGDGLSDTGFSSAASHTYGVAGTFTVTLRVTDSLGRTGTSAPQTVTVP